MTHQASNQVLAEFAPNGMIRAGINLSNPALARGTPDAPRGVTVDLANELGRRLQVGVELVCFDSAGKVVDALKSPACDIAFMAIDPARASDFSFSPPYMIIEGAYLVHRTSPYQRPEDLDVAGRRISSTKGTAYTQHLSRQLKAAELIVTDDGMATFRSEGLDAVAGIRLSLDKYAAKNPDVRILAERFMEIRQAIAIPSNRPAAARFLAEFVENVIANGFVQHSLRHSD